MNVPVVTVALNFKRNFLAAVVLLAASLAYADKAALFVKTPENGGDDSKGGESWDEAKATIGAALAEVTDGGTVTVGPGTYALDCSDASSVGLAVANGVKLVSSEGPENTIITQAANPAADSIVLTLSGAGTVVSGFAISDYVCTGVKFLTPKGSETEYATLTNCIVRNMKPTKVNGGGSAIFVYQIFALIVDCVISNNERVVTSSAKGVGMCLDGSGSGAQTVRNCIFADNRILGDGKTTPGSSGGAAIYSTKLVNKFQNCLIVGNRDESVDGAAVVVLGGTFENCTIAGNTTTEATSCGGIRMDYTPWGDSGKTLLRNTIVYGNHSSGADANWLLNTRQEPYFTATHCNSAPVFTGTDNKNVDPAFTADWKLGVSACVDGGLNQKWMTGTTDLAGNDRIVNDIVDLGCYEKVAGQLETSFEMSPETKLLAPLAATFTAKPDGSVLTGLSYKWEFNNPAVEDAEGPEYETVNRTLPVGHYTVKLTVTNSDKEKADYSKTFDVGPAVAYVRKDGSGTYPYDTAAKGATDVATALAAAVDGTVVDVGAGTFGLDASLVLDKAVRLHGASPASSVLDAQGGAFSAVDIRNAEALVDGLAISNSTLHGVVFLSGGVVSNCWICGNRAKSGAGVYFQMPGTLTRCRVFANESTEGLGFALNCAYGTVVDSCVITDNRATAGTGYGCVYSSGGTFRNTVIANNTHVGGRAGLYLVGDTTVDSCTIVGNVSGADVAGVGLTGYFVQATRTLTMNNTIVWGNRSSSGASECDFIGRGESKEGRFAGTVSHSIVDRLDDLVGTEVFYADPLLTRRFVPRRASPCVNAGTNLAWMTEARDVRGVPRILFKTVDIGAAEAELKGLLILFQ